MVSKIQSVVIQHKQLLKDYLESTALFSLVDDNDVQFITIHKKVQTADLEALLKVLWQASFEIYFHDTIHPSFSDPGAYFTYSTQKSKIDNIWSMAYGNHGWTGGIYHFKHTTLAQQIMSLVQKTDMTEIRITDNKTLFYNHSVKDKVSSLNKENEILQMHL